MPRHARIDMLGLLQHVIVRGIERRDIFLSDEDREDFVDRLATLLDETATVCYAWTLLDNHFHLLLMPTQTTLAALMRRLLTGYAVTFNLRHKRSGHLFQNRYKSIVCDGDAYLLELVRYIHLNPIRAGQFPDLDSLAQYRWSGHQQMIGKRKYQVLKEDDILSLFSSKKGAARKAYLQFLADGIANGVAPLSRGGRRASQEVDSSLTDEDLFDDRILGGGSFVERVLGEGPRDIVDRSLDDTMISVADYYDLKHDELSWPSKNRKVVAAKAVISFLAIRHYRIPGTTIAKKLGYTPSAVSRAAQRGGKMFANDEGLQDILT